MSDTQQEMLGALVGHLFFYAILIGIGIGLGFLFGRKKSKFVWWPVIVAGVLVLVGIATRIGKTEASGPTEKTMQARVFSEQLPPGNALQTDGQGLATMAKTTNDSAIQLMPEAAKELSSTARLINVSGSDFVNIETRQSGKRVLSILMRTEGSKLTRVVCNARGFYGIQFKRSECGHLADRAFGIHVASFNGDL